MKVFPTHHCFDDAMEFLERAVDLFPHLRVVHGILKAVDHQFYAHAWVEVDDTCYDAGLVEGKRVYTEWPQKDFYRLRGVRETTKYSVSEALLMNLLSGNFGPWEKRYQDLCRTDRTILGEVHGRYRG